MHRRVLFLFAFLVIVANGCREEEVVEELERYGVKREWLPFAVESGDAPIFGSYISGANPWYINREAGGKISATVERGGRSGKHSLLVITESSNAQAAWVGRSQRVVEFLGHRIRFTAYLDARKWTGTVGAGYMPGLTGVTVVDTFAGTASTPRWKKISTEVDIPPTAEHLSFVLELKGHGELRIDDCKIERIGVSASGPAPRTVDLTQRNLGFEDGDPKLPNYYGVQDSIELRMPGWNQGYMYGEYKLYIDSLSPHSGKYAGGFRTGRSKKEDDAVFFYNFPVELLEATRVRFSVWIRTEELDGIATIGVYSGRPDSAKRIVHRLWNTQGTTDWTQHSIEMDISEGATYASFAIGYVGSGALVVDDLSYKRVSKLERSKAFVDKASYFAEPMNLGFEEYYTGP
jgi:hypothetical protein